MLGCIFLMLASILISQHWAAVIIGVMVSAWIYADLPKDEKSLIVKFGDDYKSYMQSVPRMNFLVGLIRWLRRGSKG
jgi:protein-S-isoprenylcysteine O-methyltransferase Ste14